MKEVWLDRRRKAILELNTINSKIAELRKDAERVKKVLTKIEDEQLKTGLLVTEHAHQRYRERVFPAKRRRTIRQQLVTQEFLDLVKDKNGTFDHPNIKGLKVVVKDNSIVTLYNSYDSNRELNCLSLYMDYFIDLRAEKEVPITFEKFKNLLQNEIKKAISGR